MNLTLASYLGVAAGSAIGGLARYGCGLAMAALTGTAFPWGTILVNVVGSFVIGLFAALTEPGARFPAGLLTRQFVMVGLCGGYTTFSAFSLETFLLIRHGNPLAGAANIALSLVLCLAAVGAGDAIARRLNR
jgi:CrcB protein